MSERASHRASNPAEALPVPWKPFWVFRPYGVFSITHALDAVLTSMLSHDRLMTRLVASKGHPKRTLRGWAQFWMKRPATFLLDSPWSLQWLLRWFANARHHPCRDKNRMKILDLSVFWCCLPVAGLSSLSMKNVVAIYQAPMSR